MPDAPCLPSPLRPPPPRPILRAQGGPDQLFNLQGLPAITLGDAPAPDDQDMEDYEAGSSEDDVSCPPCLGACPAGGWGGVGRGGFAEAEAEAACLAQQAA